MFQRILIAVNDSEPAAWAAQAGLDLAAQLNAQAAVIHVVDLAAAVAPLMAEVGTGYSVVTHPAVVVPTAPEVISSTPSADARADGEHLLSRILARTTAPVSPMQFLREGAPVDEILNTADDWRADLIVMGTHGRRALAHLIMGSTSEAVLRRAKCPVMLVHQKPQNREPSSTNV
jgi:nucleotide-binding universal stress UspA family protein